jgi:hypothetical protein
MAASQQGTEEDFSWDDEMEQDSTASTDANTPAVDKSPIPPTSTIIVDATTPKATSSDKMPSQPAVALPSKKTSSTSTSTSPRVSEESYDLVSDQKKSAAQTDDDDSDWE